MKRVLWLVLLVVLARIAAREWNKWVWDGLDSPRAWSV